MKNHRITNILATIALILIIVPMLSFVIFRITDFVFIISLCAPVCFIISVIGIIICLLTIKYINGTWIWNLIILVISAVLSTGYSLAMWTVIKAIYAMINTLIITF